MTEFAIMQTTADLVERREQESFSLPLKLFHPLWIWIHLSYSFQLSSLRHKAPSKRDTCHFFEVVKRNEAHLIMRNLGSGPRLQAASSSCARVTHAEREDAGKGCGFPSFQNKLKVLTITFHSIQVFKISNRANAGPYSYSVHTLRKSRTTNYTICASLRKYQLCFEQEQLPFVE